MTPGLPAEDEITADVNKSSTMNTATSSPSNDMFNNASTVPKKPSFIERLEDMRDAITDTQTYATVAQHGEKVNKVASILWAGVKQIGWVVSTSSLVLIIPLLYEIDKEMGPTTDAAAAAVAASTAASTPDSASSATTTPTSSS